MIPLLKQTKLSSHAHELFFPFLSFHPVCGTRLNADVEPPSSDYAGYITTGLHQPHVKTVISSVDSPLPLYGRFPYLISAMVIFPI